MNLKENRNLIIILVIIITIILLGIALGFYYNSLPANNPQKSKQGCESVGGDWSVEQNKCLVSYKKAGEICVDGGQCKSGICFPSTLTEEQKISLFDGPIQDITGTCYSDDFATGCIEQVIKGSVSKESMCLDD
jgi:hypothetical protein